jgi:hypothetical protein
MRCLATEEGLVNNIKVHIVGSFAHVVQVVCCMIGFNASYLASTREVESNFYLSLTLALITNLQWLEILSKQLLPGQGVRPPPVEWNSWSRFMISVCR